jgi:hypothetical protein
MNAIVEPPITSFRIHPEIKRIIDEAQSRGLTEDELTAYERVLPDQRYRADAARDVAQHEELVVKRTVVDIMQLYPYQEFHLRAPEKCIRDVRYISIYATHSMLQNDIPWFHDKLLIWFRTILHSFKYPGLQAGDPSKRRAVRNAHPDLTEEAGALPHHISSIYDCYSRLRRNYEAVLEPSTWELMDEPLQTALDALTVFY